jgi:DNA-binding transcriptional ArsR family regulator
VSPVTASAVAGEHLTWSSADRDSQEGRCCRLRACARWRVVLIYNHMVVGVLADERADRVFHALADATRRDIVMRTLEGEHSVSALARRYPMSFAAVQKHVAVLEDARLVTKQRKGREKIVRADVDTIRRANQLLDGLEAVWRGRVDRMGEILADDPIGGTP